MPPGQPLVLLLEDDPQTPWNPERCPPAALSRGGLRDRIPHWKEPTRQRRRRGQTGYPTVCIANTYTDTRYRSIALSQSYRGHSHLT